MIERYSRPGMKRVWSDENKFNKWLEVEIAACEAWAEIGVVPQSALPQDQHGALNLKRMEEILKETHHDMTAFLGTVSESMGDEVALYPLRDDFVRVMDTAMSLQMVEAADISRGHRPPDRRLAKMAIEHKYTPMMGRTHGVHAEPITFGLKLAIWVEEMRRNRSASAEARKASPWARYPGRSAPMPP